MKIFISTGEVSGDWQGALLVKALLEYARSSGIDLEIVALGGDRMAEAGATMLGNTVGIGSIGLLEALPYVIPTIWVQWQAKQQLRRSPPDLVILIDYVTPNLALGRFAQQELKVPVIYYIAPQAPGWVWTLGDREVKEIVGFTSKILAIFPQEAKYYQEYGGNVVWVGHPMVDVMAKFPDKVTARKQLGIPESDLVVGLLPASRSQELKYLLPVILEAAQKIQAQLPQVKFWLPLSMERYRAKFEQLFQEYGVPVKIISGQSQLLMRAADLVLSKSGTVNLEAALLNVPQVVVYKVSKLTAWLAVNVLKFSIPFMAPPNLVEMRPIVPEFLQHHATGDRIAEACLDLLLNESRRAQTFKDYAQMRDRLTVKDTMGQVVKEVFNMLG
ncbi:lipid-A-disaccharide synthase [Synechococcus sp. PCC 7502]|uniref:lipid-A-disaccharide synthase n=1 Tax=Synechococcus sp. PCC 7502 TaxID=1173263 RepID=UPI00029FA44A|nr:lipid-A-disaccharide synthase [Synechococcus sp. PCC 7502]AFY74365.1 lipid-A-disaccharide synthase [Synechococcus sp. PCC 7502]